MRRRAPVLLWILASALPGAAVAGECAWPIKADRETLNVAYPDTASTYWSHRYRLRPGESIGIEGRPVAGRYFSLNTYDYRGRSLDGLADVDLGAGPGTVTEPGRTWRVVLRGGIAPGQEPGLLAATAGEADAGRGVLIYRVYDPDDPDDATAGAPLPTLVARSGDKVLPLKPCPDPGGSRLVRLFIRLFGPAATEAVPPEPVFLRPASAEGFFPNRDNKYLAALLIWEPGRVAVVRGRLPQIPEDMRYWSFCVGEYRKPYPVVACLRDEEVHVDADGQYTFMISTPQDRPAGVAAGDAQWLPWGDTAEVGVLLIRNMLPAADFAHAVQRVRPGETGADVMGPYYPRVSYCNGDCR